MDAHFSVLGIPRGCDESTMKKAYHQKALALHPDRNPKGAEQFKKVGEAYEALRAHFRLHGGRDVVTHLPTMRPSAGGNGPNTGANYKYTSPHAFGFRSPQAGSGFQYMRRPQPPAEEPSNLFAESGLFGCGPGGFTRERQTKGPPRGTAGGGAHEGTGANVNSGGPPVSSTHERANERWWRAHGERVPVSGYSKTRGDAGVASMQGAEAAPRPQYRSAYKGDHTQTTQRESYPFSNQSHTAGAGDRNYSTGRFSSRFMQRNGYGSPFAHHKENGHRDDGSPGDDSVSSYSDMGMDFSDDKQYTPFSPDDNSQDYDKEEKLRGVRREWSRLEKDLNRKMDKLRGGAGRGFAKEEEDYVVRKAAADAEATTRRKERERLNEAHAKGVLDERLMLKKVLFTQLYTPDPADVALMPDSDVFVLCELLRDVERNMTRVLEGRMTKGLCARCSVAAKSQCTRAFSCTHPSVCEGCAETCSMCPVCGAKRR